MTSRLFKQYTILIAEDELSIQQALREYLSEKSFTTIAVSNGQEALKVLGEKSVDLVISDIFMPLMNGLDLVRHLRSANNNIPFIFLSSYFSTELIALADQFNILALIQKPFSFENLLTEIERALHL